MTAMLCVYVFSRFTVDDAFISWRYGKNLADFGVWNYNPTLFDRTQSYTNPAFAILSVIPSLVGTDVVLFFKALAIISVVAFCALMRSVSTGAVILPMLAFVLPATVIHVFGGLETFWFALLVSAVLIFLDRRCPRNAVIFALVLFLIRPESWLFAVLLPVYFLVEIPILIEGQRRYAIVREEFNVNARRSLLIAIPLMAFLGVYLFINRSYFGSALPNTFYVKSGAGFHWSQFVQFGFFLLFAAGLAPFVEIKLTVLIFVFFGSMVISYSTSNLQMNYASRFAFHLFAPLYIFSIYLSSKVERIGAAFIIGIKGIKLRMPACVLIRVQSLLFLAAFFIISSKDAIGLATYYPRALLSHAELGKTLEQISKKYNIKSFAFGDAGMVAYHSKLISLDNIGLGSAMVARGGVTERLLDEYSIDIAIMYLIDGRVSLDSYNQKSIFDWASSRGFVKVCDIYWRKDYALRLFARTLPAEIESICSYTRARNLRSDRQMVKDAILVPPWRFWRE